MLATKQGYIFHSHLYKISNKPIFNYNDITFIHYTASKPCYIEKARIAFNKLSIIKYYKHLSKFINPKYSLNFKLLYIYVLSIAAIINSYRRRLVLLLKKVFPNNIIPTRSNFIFKKIIKYTQIK